MNQSGRGGGGQNKEQKESNRGANQTTKGIKEGTQPNNKKESKRGANQTIK